MKIKYLMSPYTHSDPAIMHKRYLLVQSAVVALIARPENANYLIYSPIAYWHPIAVRFKLPKDHHFWAAVDRAAILASHEAILLKAKGWEDSKGVQAEFQFAHTIGITVVSFTPGELGLVES